MERLTERDESGRACLTNYGKKIYCSTQATADCIAELEEHLAAYNDTGLMPEEIKQLKAQALSGVLDSPQLTEYDGSALQRADKYIEQLESEIKRYREAEATLAKEEENN